MFDLTGKVAVITGAASGLGKDAAKCLAKAGAYVVLLDMNVDNLKVSAKEILAGGGKCLAFKCNVTSEEQIRNVINAVKHNLGRIDILVNDAGVAVRGGVDTLSLDDWDKSMNVNVKSMFLTSKYIVPIMKENKYGRIINISSINAIIGDKAETFIRHSYCASKSAVLGLTKAMAASYGKYGITVNAIGPGLFNTGMTENTLFKNQDFLKMYDSIVPLCRPGNNGELNGVVLFFASDAASYVTGQFLLVDGGLSIV